MAAAVSQSANDAAAAETEKETAMSEGHGHTCNECGTMMAEGDHECMECGYMEESEQLDEWANQVNSKTEEQEFTTEMDYMMKLISGGLNNQKVDQTTVPSARVKVEETDMAAQLKKLAGLR
jgi:RNA polymerase subunit RPABC4/transcription elongation factor Spt4